jgi:hypothetical protein
MIGYRLGRWPRGFGIGNAVFYPHHHYLMGKKTNDINHITDDGKLRIWQQNINRSLLGQQDLLNMLGNNDYDICAIQEPYLDYMHKTRANALWGWFRARERSIRGRYVSVMKSKSITGKGIMKS